MKKYRMNFTSTGTTNLLKAVGFITRNYLAAKVLALVLITALLMPLIFFGGFGRTSAQVPASTLKMNFSAPVSAPPQAFNLSSADSVSAKTLASVSSFNTSIINGYSSLVNAVTAPVLPEGFKMAQPVSPLYSFMSSSAFSASATLGAFLGFSTATAETTANLLTTETAFNNTAYNFAGDSKSDFARWTPSNGEWSIKPSGGGTNIIFSLGNSASVLAPGDFDGDLITDPAVFNAGTWTIKPSGGGSQYTISFGTSGDIPATGDYNGDGRSDYAIFRPSSGTFWIQLSSDLSYYSESFGAAGDIPVPGDYDGDGITDLAVYRPSEGVWYIKQSSNGITINPPWGVATDIPVPADYDGDGITDLAVYRPSSGTWYIYKSTGGGYIQQTWGNYGDQPVPADYDGDGKADLAIWRPKTGVWFTYKSCNYDNSCGANPPYIYETLGMNGDVPVAAAYIKKIGGLVQDYDLAKLRLSPKNATGGTDLYSRNFSWGTGLVGLPGRAGLGAGFGISYNSLVWLKDTQNDVMIFDPDQSNVSPGFKMGFPTIEPVYYDKDTKNFSYLMVTPSGGRVEFQQTAASDTYETVDSSYVQLKTNGASSPNDPVDDITITITGTDGTQMNYEWLAGAFRCNQIKDRNGNYITIVHDEYGLLRTVTDTLGRVITVGYDTEFYPTSITQQWQTNNGQSSTTTTHTWASFAYTTKTISTNFHSSLGVFGPGNGTSIKVLQKVTYSDGSYTTFDYNGYGQVWKVNNYAADWNVLNYVRTNLETPAANQTDCPRFSETRSWVKNFNLDEYNQEQEVVVTNEMTTGHQIPDMDGNTVTASRIQVAMQNHPHENITNIYVGESGWMESLPILVNDYANGNTGTPIRSNRTKWTQDDENLAFIKNPRVVETRISDPANTKRTTIDYYMLDQTASYYGLVSEIAVYDTDQTTVLKKEVTEYLVDEAYFSRRMVGLPSKKILYGRDETGVLTFAAVREFGYDEEDFTQEANQNISNVMQHDTVNFGASLVAGRGNLTSVTRQDVTGQTAAAVSKLRYDTAGSVVAQIDPLGRKARIEYADSFNDGGNTRGTFAYPTKIFDAANNYSEVKYRFDTGANVWAKSPAPENQTQGKITEREFDAYGRLFKQKIVNTGAYTRYEYPANGVQSKVYATITDTNNNGADAADEVMSESWTDGAGRVLMSRTEHPGSTGGWSGSRAEYDILGRIKRQSVPTEINSSWNPAGDDAQRGFLWTYQKYDWMDRVVRRINTDGVDSPNLNESDVLISYEGCGCAGGLVTTVKGEEIVERDWEGLNPQSLGRRTQKIYQDILGRAYKTEILNWDNSVYSTVETVFNGRDQAVTVTQTEAATSTSQTTVMSYDGHGRVKTKKRPEQTSATSYNYHQDDSISTVVDARGASTNYSYNDVRGLLTNISYAVPGGSTIPAAPPVSFSYDALGNRTQMTDGLGTVAYSYNQLSQMTSETRQFNDTLANAPLSGNGFRLEYEYTLSGQLKSLKDPFDDRIDYAHDKAGRLNAVNGTPFAGFTNYAGNPQYRAWGGLKTLTYGNGAQMTMTFNNRLQADYFELIGTSSTNPEIMKKNYAYYADGNLRKVEDLKNSRFDRLIKYDNLGRPAEGKSSMEARGTTAQPSEMEHQLPYRQSYQYDAFNNMTQRNNLHWGIESWYGESNNLNYTYQNNRITNQGWQHDADGRVTASDFPDRYIHMTYDAAGRSIKMVRPVEKEIERFYSGEGREVKRKEKTFYNDDWVIKPTKYFIRSSVLGGEVVSEVDATGRKRKTFVRGAGVVLAWQTVSYYNNTTTEYVNFEHRDASGMSYRSTQSNGIDIYSEGAEGSPAELDPLGGNVGLSTPYIEITVPPEPGYPTFELLGYESPMYVNGQRVSATLDGIEVPLSLVQSAVQSGSAAQCPNNNCGPRVYQFNGQNVLSSPFMAYANGTSGFWIDANDPNSPAPPPGVIDGGGVITRFVQVSTYFNVSWDTRWTPRRISDNEAKVLKDTVKATLDRTEECRKYIVDLINQVAKNHSAEVVSTDIEKLFDIVLNSRGPGATTNTSGGIWLTGNDRSGASVAINHWKYIGGPKHATLLLNFALLRSDFPNNNREQNILWFSTSQVNGGIITIHELMHVAVKGAGNDFHFATAAAQLAGDDPPVFEPTIGANGNILVGTNSKASAYWQSRLSVACDFEQNSLYPVTRLYK